MTADELMAKLVEIDRPDLPVLLVIDLPLRTLRLGVEAVEVADLGNLIIGSMTSVEIRSHFYPPSEDR